MRYTGSSKEKSSGCEAVRRIKSTLRSYESNRKAVIALDSDGLNHRGRQSRIGGEKFIKPPHTLNSGIAACFINHAALTHYVISNDHCPAPR